MLRAESRNEVGSYQDRLVDWWEAASPLLAGREYVTLDANLTNLVHVVAGLERDPARRERMSAAATAFVRTYLSEEVCLL